MAHEIAHVAARHGTRQATRGEFAQTRQIPLIFLGGWAGYGIRQAAEPCVPLGFLHSRRAFESEADMLGLQYMYKAGYDPDGVRRLLRKNRVPGEAQAGHDGESLLHASAHGRPHQGSRRRVSRRYLKAKPEYVLNTSEFNDVKARLIAMHNHRKIDDKDLNKPRLRRAPGSTTGPVDANDDGTTPKGDQDERPTLKRRPDSDSN